MREKGVVIAIDGPAGAGKSTAARELARRLGYQYLDTGAMFRAVAWKALQLGLALEDREAVENMAVERLIEFAGERRDRIAVDGEDVTERIRTPPIARAASKIAAYPRVREVLTRVWRQVGREGGVILEGRDIGTVAFPDAELKFFLDARAEVRAERRFREAERAEGWSLDHVAQELSRRDAADRARVHAPLVQAEDAVVIDTSELSASETANLLEREARKRIAALAARGQGAAP